ncbi:putative conserved membrane protein [Synechococcus sp. BIOS-E4-1]|uniref:DUF4079 domain-containing protein n=1 Tax=Synechococcus sp. BIOS-E4-1 TaxID=1400864 RepID=UPI0016494CE2|nr:DUF4079 domain-containing protein [Synechococcus sp. BIOS-E4-1]QNI52945.1 putative conserved membrane protein [Synechococcus sp. BIOS-E4-1]
MPPTLSFGLNFLHPLMMWLLLAAGGYAMYLGIKAKKVRTGTCEQRKALIPGKFAQRHYLWGSALMAVMVFGTLGGMAVTYLNNGKLFVGPHLLVGLLMTGMIAAASSLSPLMQRGNLLARKAHVGLNMGMLTLFLWQAISGMQIMNRIWINR